MEKSVNDLIVIKKSLESNLMALNLELESINNSWLRYVGVSTQLLKAEGHLRIPLDGYNEYKRKYLQNKHGNTSNFMKSFTLCKQQEYRLGAFRREHITKIDQLNKEIKHITNQIDRNK